MISAKQWTVDIQDEIIVGLYEKIKRLEKQLAEEREKTQTLSWHTKGNSLIIEINSK